MITTGLVIAEVAVLAAALAVRFCRRDAMCPRNLILAGVAVIGLGRAVAVLFGAIPSLAASEAMIALFAIALSAVLCFQLRQPLPIDSFSDATINACPTPIMIKDAKGRYLAVNPAFEQTFQVRQKDVVGKRAAEIWPPEIADKANRSDSEILEDGGPQCYETWVQNENDSVSYWRVEKFPIALNNGRRAIAAIYSDMTEQRLADQRLADSEERYALASQHAGIWDWDLRKGTLYVSPAFARLVGLTPGEAAALTNEAVERMFHPDDLPAHRQIMKAHVADASVAYDNVSRLRMPDGDYHWFHMIGRGYRQPDGSVVRITGMITDIDAERRSADALRVNEARMSNLLDNSPAPIYFKDQNRRFIMINKRYTEVYGVNPADVVGRTSEEVFGGEMGGRFAAHDLEVLEIRDLIVREENIHGTMFMTAKFPIIDTDGTMLGVGGIETDITQRIEIENAYRQARDDAESANRAKSTFLANMSHELRTPLNSIIGFSDSLLAGTLGPLMDNRQGDYLQHIRSAGEHLLDVINDILDISRIESGRMKLEKTEIDIAAVVADAIQLTDERARNAGLEIIKTIAADLETIAADRRQLLQVLINLLSNAIKFTPPGGRIEISTAQFSSGGIEIRIADTGAGMNPDDLDIVQEPFVQIADSLTRTHEGSGLGLSIVSSIIEQHGGTFRLESAPGQGTTAIVQLPGCQSLTETG